MQKFNMTPSPMACLVAACFLVLANLANLCQCAAISKADNDLTDKAVTKVLFESESNQTKLNDESVALAARQLNSFEPYLEERAKQIIARQGSQDSSGSSSARSRSRQLPYYGPPPTTLKQQQQQQQQQQQTQQLHPRPVAYPYKQAIHYTRPAYGLSQQQQHPTYYNYQAQRAPAGWTQNTGYATEVYYGGPKGGKSVEHAQQLGRPPKIYQNGAQLQPGTQSFGAAGGYYPTLSKSNASQDSPSSKLMSIVRPVIELSNPELKIYTTKSNLYGSNGLSKKIVIFKSTKQHQEPIQTEDNLPQPDFYVQEAASPLMTHETTTKTPSPTTTTTTRAPTTTTRKSTTEAKVESGKEVLNEKTELKEGIKQAKLDFAKDLAAKKVELGKGLIEEQEEEQEDEDEDEDAEAEAEAELDTDLVDKKVELKKDLEGHNQDPIKDFVDKKVELGKDLKENKLEPSKGLAEKKVELRTDLEEHKKDPVKGVVEKKLELKKGELRLAENLSEKNDLGGIRAANKLETEEDPLNGQPKRDPKDLGEELKDKAKLVEGVDRKVREDKEKAQFELLKRGQDKLGMVLENLEEKVAKSPVAQQIVQEEKEAPAKLDADHKQRGASKTNDSKLQANSSLSNGAPPVEERSNRQSAGDSSASNQSDNFQADKANDGIQSSGSGGGSGWNQQEETSTDENKDKYSTRKPIGLKQSDEPIVGESSSTHDLKPARPLEADLRFEPDAQEANSGAEGAQVEDYQPVEVGGDREDSSGSRPGEGHGTTESGLDSTASGIDNKQQQAADEGQQEASLENSLAQLRRMLEQTRMAGDQENGQAKMDTGGRGQETTSDQSDQTNDNDRPPARKSTDLEQSGGGSSASKKGATLTASRKLEADENEMSPVAAKAGESERGQSVPLGGIPKVQDTHERQRRQAWLRWGRVM